MLDPKDQIKEAQEKYKLLYEVAKKTLDDELDRSKRLDEKAGRYLTAISVGILAFSTLLARVASQGIEDINGLVAAVLIFLCVLTTITIFYAWFALFKAIKLTATIKMEVNEELKEVFEEESLITCYWILADLCAEACRRNQAALQQTKVKYLNEAYAYIGCSMRLICATLFLYLLVRLAI